MDDAMMRSASARANMAEKSRRHLYGADADAQAELLLRHRLFPRAMAWNATQQAVVTQQQPQTQPQAAVYEPPPPRAESWSSEYRRELEQMQPADSSPLPMAALRARARQQQAANHHHARQPSLDVSGSFTAQLHAFNLDDPQLNALSPLQPSASTTSSASTDIPAQAIHEALSFARSFPLLHAANGVIEQELQRQKENMRASNSNSNNNSESRRPFALPPHDAREQLFRTMGKWFDGSSNGSGSNASVSGGGGSRASIASSAGGLSVSDAESQLLQHIPRRATFDSVAQPPPPPIAISFASTVSTSSFASLGPASSIASAQQQPPSAVNAYSNYDSSRDHHSLPANREPRSTPSPTRSLSNRSDDATEGRDRRSPPHRTTTSSAAASSSYGKKRQRATPAPSLAKALLTGCGAKRCSFADCGKIAVSKGLCRGHGGGRRCQFAGCTKCAQSRSPFCWAHGGGKRCEAPNCRRSRKTKHFCVDHVELEERSSAGASPADSDESMDGGASATDVDAALHKAIERQRQHQYAGQLTQHAHRSETTHHVDTNSTGANAAGRRAQLAAQLPSLNDALKRSFPSPDALQTSERVFQLQQFQVTQQTFNFDMRR